MFFLSVPVTTGGGSDDGGTSFSFGFHAADELENALLYGTDANQPPVLEGIDNCNGLYPTWEAFG